jgi:hypothetical protein
MAYMNKARLKRQYLQQKPEAATFLASLLPSALFNIPSPRAAEAQTRTTTALKTANANAKVA